MSRGFNATKIYQQNMSTSFCQPSYLSYMYLQQGVSNLPHYSMTCVTEVLHQGVIKVRRLCGTLLQYIACTTSRPTVFYITVPCIFLRDTARNHKYLIFCITTLDVTPGTQFPCLFFLFKHWLNVYDHNSTILR